MQDGASAANFVRGESSYPDDAPLVRYKKYTAWQHRSEEFAKYSMAKYNSRTTKTKVDLPWFLPQDITCISEPLARQPEFLVLGFSSILLAHEIGESCEDDHGKRVLRTTEFNLANHAI